MINREDLMKAITGTFVYSAFIVLAIVLGACSSYSKEAFQGYVGEERSIEELATIRMDENVEWLKVSGHIISHKEFGEMILQPGSYEIEWGTYFGVSVLVKSSGRDKRTWRGSINLRPGYTYTIYADRTLGVGYVVTSWIEDNYGEKVEMNAKQIWAD
jgi:hypothetical protein